MNEEKKTGKKHTGLMIVLLILVIVVAGVFLCKGVRHKEKEISPIEVKQVTDHIYLMNDNGESTGYIVVGEKMAAVIDTMWGRENIYDVVRTKTQLPVFVINTHGHLDHIYGNAYFDEVYIHPDDLALADINYTYPDYKKLAKNNHLNKVSFRTVKEGDSFDLGGVTLEIYDCPGHTQGGICILDKQDRVLFTGDSINRHCWMQLEESTSLEEFYESLDRLSFLTGQYDYILCGHTEDLDTASLYEEHKAAVKEVIDQVGRDEDEYYDYYGGTCKIHNYTKGNVGIVYRE